MSRDDRTGNAWDELNEILFPEETLEKLIFGKWDNFGTQENPEKAMPIDQLLTPEEAKPFMRSWQFSGGFGGADVFPMFAWSNKRIFWVHEYDGATTLRWAPRYPEKCKPSLDGKEIPWYG